MGRKERPLASDSTKKWKDPDGRPAQALAHRGPEAPQDAAVPASRRQGEPGETVGGQPHLPLVHPPYIVQKI